MVSESLIIELFPVRGPHSGISRFTALLETILSIVLFVSILLSCIVLLTIFSRKKGTRVCLGFEIVVIKVVDVCYVLCCLAPVVWCNVYGQFLFPAWCRLALAAAGAFFSQMVQVLLALFALNMALSLLFPLHYAVWLTGNKRFVVLLLTFSVCAVLPLHQSLRVLSSEEEVLRSSCSAQYLANLTYMVCFPHCLMPHAVIVQTVVPTVTMMLSYLVMGWIACRQRRRSLHSALNTPSKFTVRERYRHLSKAKGLLFNSFLCTFCTCAHLYCSYHNREASRSHPEQLSAVVAMWVEAYGGFIYPSMNMVVFYLANRHVQDEVIGLLQSPSLIIHRQLAFLTPQSI